MTDVWEECVGFHSSRYERPLEFQSDGQCDALKAEGSGEALDPQHITPRTLKLSSISCLLSFSLKAAKEKKKNVLRSDLIVSGTMPSRRLRTRVIGTLHDCHVDMRSH